MAKCGCTLITIGKKSLSISSGTIGVIVISKSCQTHLNINL